ncbi:HTTM domain protein [Stanieria cyanosphaera PCC 7437]|uniref:HTTM domain protein n=1 Tax=Stanieria cyanosphaera (strain ATCC 29371 / PCC 7437) TaxID=111780 RepID=K9XV73_STAC7|nr:HTTM domain-containing protein [Stanieria cyanosphaera]AFZ36500.1 HTTM domain protein [Stanieria cyanosphaera PCC 7437]
MAIAEDKSPSKLQIKLEEIFGLDLRSLALFRIGLASVIITDLVIRFGDIQAHYSDYGVLPRIALIEEFIKPWYWSIHLLSGEPFVQVILFGFALFFAFLLLIGYRTKLATIASWAMIISLHNRNPALIFAGDDTLRAIAFWSMFLPLGAYYSVDNALNNSTKPLPKRIVSGATLGFILQLCYIYMFSAWFKHQSPLWSQEGSAVYYALNFDQYGTGFGQFLLQLTPLLPTMTFSALWFEWSGALLLFIPFRTNFFRCVAIISFILLHFSFGLSFTIGIFPILCIVVWLAFIPSNIWNWLEKKTYSQEKAGLKINYDKDCGFCKKVVHFLRTFLILPGTPLLVAQDNVSVYADMQKYNSWVVEDWQGNRHYKWEAIAYVVSLSPLFWFLVPILRLKPLMVIGNKFYETIASNRKCAGNFTKPFLFRPLEITYSLTFNLLTLLILCLVTFWNIKSFASSHIFNHNQTKLSQGLKRVTNSKTAQRIDWLSQLTRLDQSWSIFAPNPPRDDGWHVIVGNQKDGNQVNLLQDDTNISWDKLTIQQRNKLYKNMQWRTYFINLNRNIGNKLYPYYGQYLCRNWNTKHSKQQQLNRVDIYFMSEKTVPPGEQQTVEKQAHWQQSCDE